MDKNSGSGLMILPPPGVPASELEQLARNAVPTGGLCQMCIPMFKSSTADSDSASVTCEFCFFQFASAFCQCGKYNMCAASLLCDALGCVVGCNPQSMFFGPIIAMVSAVVSIGPECGLGLGCLGHGCFYGTQTQLMRACCLTCGDREIDIV